MLLLKSSKLSNFGKFRCSSSNYLSLWLSTFCASIVFLLSSPDKTMSAHLHKTKTAKERYYINLVQTKTVDRHALCIVQLGRGGHSL